MKIGRMVGVLCLHSIHALLCVLAAVMVVLVLVCFDRNSIDSLSLVADFVV